MGSHLVSYPLKTTTMRTRSDKDAQRQRQGRATTTRRMNDGGSFAHSLGGRLGGGGGGSIVAVCLGGGGGGDGSMYRCGIVGEVILDANISTISTLTTYDCFLLAISFFSCRATVGTVPSMSIPCIPFPKIMFHTPSFI